MKGLPFLSRWDGYAQAAVTSYPRFLLRGTHPTPCCEGTSSKWRYRCNGSVPAQWSRSVPGGPSVFGPQTASMPVHVQGELSRFWQLARESTWQFGDSHSAHLEAGGVLATRVGT